MFAPHFIQNAAFSGSSAPHFGHIMIASSLLLLFLILMEACFMSRLFGFSVG